MEFIAGILVLLGLLGIVISFLSSLFFYFKKDERKNKYFKYLGLSFAVFAVGMVLAPGLSDEEKAWRQVAEQQQEVKSNDTLQIIGHEFMLKQLSDKVTEHHLYANFNKPLVKKELERSRSIKTPYIYAFTYKIELLDGTIKENKYKTHIEEYNVIENNTKLHVTDSSNGKRFNHSSYRNDKAFNSDNIKYMEINLFKRDDKTEEYILQDQYVKYKN